MAGVSRRGRPCRAAALRCWCPEATSPPQPFSEPSSLRSGGRPFLLLQEACPPWASVLHGRVGRDPGLDLSRLWCAAGAGMEAAPRRPGGHNWGSPGGQTQAAALNLARPASEGWGSPLPGRAQAKHRVRGARPPLAPSWDRKLLSLRPTGLGLNTHQLRTRPRAEHLSGTASYKPAHSVLAPLYR